MHELWCWSCTGSLLLPDPWTALLQLWDVFLHGCGVGCQRKEQQQRAGNVIILSNALEGISTAVAAARGDVPMLPWTQVCAAGGISRAGIKTWLRGSLLPSQAAVSSSSAPELLVLLRAASEQWLFTQKAYRWGPDKSLQLRLTTE